MSDEPALAEGIAEYLSAVRITSDGARPSLETARLIADRDAHRIAIPRPAGMQVTGSFIVGGGRETPVRIYRPAGEGARAAILFFHGGGFTSGSLETYDPLATALAEASGATVISVHYRRLPEATPRAIVEEGFDALRWVAAMAGPLEIDANRIAIAGDSAGAYIATLVALAARDQGGPALVAQLLFYGLYDVEPGREAYRLSRDPVLAPAVLDAVIATYREFDARDPAPWAPPLHTRELSGLPPAVLLGAEHDPLLGEGQEYSARLQACGVTTRYRVAAGMPHGFLRAVRFSPPARAEMAWAGDSFRTLIQA